jgi:putative aminopeptidase FrvX
MIRQLIEVDGVSGREGEVGKLFADLIGMHVDEIDITNMGAVVGIINPGQHRSIMIAAHMDEVGLMVRYISKQGYLYFVPIGGLSVATIQDQEVRSGLIYGVIGSTPPHLLEKGQQQKLENMFIDIGAKDADEVAEMGIKVGSTFVINSEIRNIGSYIMGKALDDRAGLSAMVEALDGLTRVEDLTIYVVGSTQEEVGLKGVRSAIDKYNPDIAIAIDVTMAGDNPAVPEIKAPVKCGEGPVLVIADGAGRGILSDMHLNARIESIAESHEIPLQPEVSSGGTTDATMMQVLGEGRAATVLSIPTRYIHSPRTVMHRDDYDSLVKLLRAIMEEL